MTRSIVICEYISTGLNYIDDVRARGYEPVLVEGTYVGTPEDQATLRATRDAINRHLAGSVKIILDISDERSYADLESLVQQVFTFVGKIRRGGRILVPESTYVHLPYQMEGMEILLRVPGLRIEMPISDMVSLLVASVE